VADTQQRRENNDHRQKDQNEPIGEPDTLKHKKCRYFSISISPKLKSCDIFSS